jgi:hypothetical protein
MVRVRMGQDETIEPLDALPPQEWGDHALADVEPPFGEAARVDEHLPAARELDEDGVSRADVEDRDLET